MSGGTYPRELEAQGDRDPGQGAKPSQTIAHHGPICPQRMFWDCRRKPEYPEEAPKAWGEHADSACAHRAEEGFEPPTLDVRGKLANQ